MTYLKKLFDQVEVTKKILSNETVSRKDLIENLQLEFWESFNPEVLGKHLFFGDYDGLKIETDLVKNLSNDFGYKHFLFCHPIDFELVEQVKDIYSSIEVYRPTFDQFLPDRYEKLNFGSIYFSNNSLSYNAQKNSNPFFKEKRDLIFVDLFRIFHFKQLWLIDNNGIFLNGENEIDSEYQVPDDTKLSSLERIIHAEKTIEHVIDYLFNNFLSDNGRIVFKAPPEIEMPSATKYDPNSPNKQIRAFDSIRNKYSDNIEAIFNIDRHPYFNYLVFSKKKSQELKPFTFLKNKFDNYKTITGYIKPDDFKQSWSIKRFNSENLKHANSFENSKTLNELFPDLELIAPTLLGHIYEEDLFQLKENIGLFEKQDKINEFIEFFEKKPDEVNSLVDSEVFILADNNIRVISKYKPLNTKPPDLKLFKIKKENLLKFRDISLKYTGANLHFEIKEAQLKKSKIKIKHYLKKSKYSAPLLKVNDIIYLSHSNTMINKYPTKKIYLSYGMALRTKEFKKLFKFLNHESIIELTKFQRNIDFTKKLLELRFPDLHEIEDLNKQIEYNESILSNDRAFKWFLKHLNSIGWDIEKEKKINSLDKKNISILDYCLSQNSKTLGYIEIKSNRNVSIEDLKTHCKKFLVYFKMKFGIYFVSDKYFIGTLNEKNTLVFNETYTFPSPNELIQKGNDEIQDANYSTGKNSSDLLPLASMDLFLKLVEDNKKIKEELINIKNEIIEGVNTHTTNEIERVITFFKDEILNLNSQIKNIRFDSTLSQSEKIEKFESEIDKLDTPIELLNEVDFSDKKWYKNWTKLQPNTQTFLKEAFVISKYIEVDFSPVIVQLFRTIENELSKKIFLSFRENFSKKEIEFLFEKNGEQIKNGQWKSQLKIIYQQYLSYNNPKFTYENIENLLSFIPEFDFLLNDSNSTLRQKIYSEIKLFKEIQKHIERKFEKLGDEKIFKSFNELKEDRNGGAHDRVIMKNKFEEFMLIFDNVFEKFTNKMF